MSPPELLSLLDRCVDAALDAIGEVDGAGRPASVLGQFEIDLLADGAIQAVLEREKLGVVSEESGYRDLDRDVIVVVDPIDGSNNASTGAAGYGPSLYVAHRGIGQAAVVHDVVTGVRWRAMRERGTWRNEIRVHAAMPALPAPTRVAVYGDGGPPLGSPATMGATALELAGVADGSIQGYAVTRDADVPQWDYLAGLMLAEEAGAWVGELDGRDPWRMQPGSRRRPVAAASESLYGELVAAFGRRGNRAGGAGQPQGAAAISD